MSGRSPLVLANWKLFGADSRFDAFLEVLLAQKLIVPACGLTLCPAFPYLTKLAQRLRGTGIRLGAQSVSDQAQGDFTGEVSAVMLADVGCQVVLIGHSERRSWYGETNTNVLNKIEHVVAAGLIPVVCVGESLAEYEAGAYESTLNRQIVPLLQRLPATAWERLCIGYEPAWAIGTGKSADPEYANLQHARIRHRIATVYPQIAAKIQIVYGGSVNPNNAAAFHAMPDIDGALVGRASQDPAALLEICRMFAESL